MSQRLRILLVDDHVLFRKGLGALISARADLELVGEASNGLEAIEAAHRLAPDVILMDIHMPRLSGLEAVQRISAEMPQVRVVMLTISDDDSDLFAAIKAGAFGYLLKNMEPDQLFELLDGIRRDEAPVAGVLATKILEEFRHREHAAAPAMPASETLTLRETDVLKLVAQGGTNREIAAALFITENTVKIHLRNILEKLHLQNRTQAGAYAVRQGLLEGSDGAASDHRST